jgi:hypothetical protein
MVMARMGLAGGFVMALSTSRCSQAPDLDVDLALFEGHLEVMIEKVGGIAPV